MHSKRFKNERRKVAVWYIVKYRWCLMSTAMTFYHINIATPLPLLSISSFEPYSVANPWLDLSNPVFFPISTEGCIVRIIRRTVYLFFIWTVMDTSVSFQQKSHYMEHKNDYLICLSIILYEKLLANLHLSRQRIHFLHFIK